jgi:protein associated with RNAse G/E
MIEHSNKMNEPIAQQFESLWEKAKSLCTPTNGGWTISQYSPNAQTQRVFKDLHCLDRHEGIFCVTRGTKVEETSGKVWEIPSDGFMIFPPNAEYNLFIYKGSNGVHFYLNLSAPLVVTDAKKNAYYKDLYIDIRLNPDDSIEVLDQDEFLVAQKTGLLTSMEAEKCFENTKKLYDSALNRLAPFNLEELKKLLI